MSTMDRGKDAQDQAPHGTAPQADGKQAKLPSDNSKGESPGPAKGGGQDAANYETADQGQAIEVENMSSANDEGAN